MISVSGLASTVSMPAVIAPIIEHTPPPSVRAAAALHAKACRKSTESPRRVCAICSRRCMSRPGSVLQVAGGGRTPPRLLKAPSGKKRLASTTACRAIVWAVRRFSPLTLRSPSQASTCARSIGALERAVYGPVVRRAVWMSSRITR